MRFMFIQSFPKSRNVMKSAESVLYFVSNGVLIKTKMYLELRWIME